MSFDEEHLAKLLRRLPPPPAGWVQAAQELPAARAALDNLVARAQADAVVRSRVLADLEAALAAQGIEPRPRVVDELRKRLDTH